MRPVTTEEDAGGELVTRRSQFRHLRALLERSREACPGAWLAFLDNDDMFHPERIKFFQENLGKMKESYPARKAFCCGSKALISEVRASSRHGVGKVFPLDQLLDGHAALNGVVEVATSAQDNMEKDTMEFFDFCVHSDPRNFSDLFFLFVAARFSWLLPNVITQNDVVRTISAFVFFKF